MTQDNNVVPKLRKLAAYLEANPDLGQCYGQAIAYPEVCILGALALANGAQANEAEYLAYELLGDGDTDCLTNAAFVAANDQDNTDFDTFRHFIDSCDDETLADMMASLEETE